ncbi:MAG: SCO family protein [Proteobacteria bacterium]|nr:SCO family protein [Pseudomonadota bacterium]
MRRISRIRLRIATALLLVLATVGANAAPSLFSIEKPWLDENGRQVTLSQWRGSLTLVAMEYSACRFICSVYWRRLVEIQDAADRAGQKVEFVILSIDPEHDSPALWREYRKARSLTRDNWHFLTGTREMTTRAAALLGEHWWYDEGHLMHDFKVVRLDQQGRVVAAMTTYTQPADQLLGRF